jgi:hypothetical protein
MEQRSSRTKLACPFNGQPIARPINVFVRYLFGDTTPRKFDSTSHGYCSGQEAARPPLHH